MNPRAIKIDVAKDYTIHIVFESGETKIFDFKPLLNFTIYRPLKDRSFFSSAFVKDGVIQWPSDIDLCPDRAYIDSN